MINLLHCNWRKFKATPHLRSNGHLISRALIFLYCMMAIPAFSQTVDTPRQIANEEKADIVLSSAQGVMSQKIEHPGAAFIKLHLEDVMLSRGDRIIITGANEQRYIVRARDLKKRQDDSMWALSIMGERATVLLKQSRRNALAGRTSRVVIDKYMRGYSSQEITDKNEFAIQTVCGADDRREAACYENSEPDAFNRANAVARLLMPCNENGQGGLCTCTAWRVGPNPNTMITNNHCISDSRQISRSEVRFNFQNSQCNGNDASSRQVIVPVDEILVTNYTLDMSLITVQNASSIEQFGFLELDDRRPVAGESIYIPQHPGGRDKELAIVSDIDGGIFCQVDRAVTNGRGTNTDLSYSCDTEGGSSGSPVLARSTNKVLGLHHFGRCNNRGVRIDLVAEEVAPFLGGDTSNCSAPINFAGNTVEYSNSSPGSAQVSADGASITLSGNEWRITNSGYNISANTEVQFDFSATGTAEIIGIGFDPNTGASSNRVFQLGGTQNWGIGGFNYSGNGSTQSFTIPVGEFFTGNSLGFVIANDKDSGQTNNTVTVSNVRVCN